MGNIISDFQIQFDTAQSGMKEGVELLDMLGDDWRVIFDKQNQLVGYWVLIALNDEEFEKVKKGTFDEKSISLDNIDFIDLPGDYNGYLWMMGAKPKKWTSELQMILVESLVEYIEGNAKNGLFFRSIYSLVESRQDISIRSKLGMEMVAEHMYGGKVLCLDIKELSQKPLLKARKNLCKLYEEHFNLNHK